MAGLFAKHKEAVISLIVWAIVAAGCLLYFGVLHKPAGSAPSDPSTASTSPSNPSIAPRPASTDIDFPGYFAAFDRLASPGEQEEFVKSLKGRKVRWRGYVSYVRNSDVSRSKIALAITPTASDESQMALVYFGEDLRDRLLALREKGAVEISGTFDSDRWNTPYIQGDTVQPLASIPTAPPARAADAQ
jgi:hypothetical protein